MPSHSRAPGASAAISSAEGPPERLLVASTRTFPSSEPAWASAFATAAARQREDDDVTGSGRVSDGRGSRRHSCFSPVAAGLPPPPITPILTQAVHHGRYQSPCCRSSVREDRLRRAELLRPRRGAGRRAAEEPLLFAKWPSSLIGPGEPIVIPPIVTKARLRGGARRRDRRAREGRLEGERVRGGSRLPLRERRQRARPAVRRRAVDARQVAGHVLSRRADDAARRDRAIRMRSAIRAIVSGEVLQDSTTANLIFGVDDVIAYASQTTTLEPGDLILTGTPAGVGVFRDPQRLLRPGRRGDDRDRGARVAHEPGGRRMKLGLLTAPFPRRSLKQVAAWAAGEGFEMLEVACWPAAGGERRRYAGTSHIDVSQRRRRRSARRARPPRARDLVARVLPEQPPPRSRRAPRGEHAPAEGDRRRREARRRRSSARSSGATRRRTSPTTSASSARSGRGSSTTRSRAA